MAAEQLMQAAPSRHAFPRLGTQPLVLLADGEPGVRRLVTISLTAARMNVVAVPTGAEAIGQAEKRRPDIALLETVLPDTDGITVMRLLRETKDVPVIFLSSRASAAEMKHSLDQGADDFVAKPFHPDELAARVRCVLRRCNESTQPAETVSFDDIEIDLERRMVRRAGRLVRLSRTEWRLLQYLAARPGVAILHAQLLASVWGPEYVDDVQYLRVWIARLRRKLGMTAGAASRIRTFREVGYLVDIDGGQPREGDAGVAEMAGP